MSPAVRKVGVTDFPTEMLLCGIPIGAKLVKLLVLFQGVLTALLLLNLCMKQ